MRTQILRWVIVSAILISLTVGLAWSGLHQTEGWLTFPLDDAYIHLSIAQEVRESGNLGPSPFQFQNSSSSPGFTLILGMLAQLMDLTVWLPMLLNAGLACLWVWVVVALLIPSHYPSLMQVGIPLLLGLLIPIPLLILNGMEHMAHLLMVTLFLREASRKLHDNAHPNGLLMLATLLMCTLRYESIFLVLCFAVLAIYLRFWRNALFVLALGAMPIVMVGLVSLSQGGTFWPLSIIGKGHFLWDASAIGQWGLEGVNRYYTHPFMLILVLLLWAATALHKEGNTPYRFWNLIVLGATLLHVQCAEVGGYRYEAYLIGAGLLGVLLTPSHLSLLKPASRWRRVNQAGIFVSVSLFFVLRAGFFLAQYPTFVQNIYQQQVQVAQFVRHYFPESSIGVNDIGALSYYTQAQLTDFVAIGDQGMAHLLDAGNWNPVGLRALAAKRKMELAIVHPQWADQAFPPEWIPIAQWTIPDNQICASETVVFYVVDPSSRKPIQQALEEMEPTLPTGVTAQWLMLPDTTHRE